ncbi:LysR substrate-binding domain-containing protein [Reyranella sp. CPCC 100927]|uniref:LysR substrate-binding domain-containing protein n=1 Tax=Reyranella sp. CPCC 100927 TaxID=2599616 RepID=UPI0011B544E7|nr:LysR substrate-binding domain-containing protein [Reyranella sp. CPCC 100927]TWS99827.1 LysR family transcriptional regulator [Reyranella sp. CPCC 100927]
MAINLDLTILRSFVLIAQGRTFAETAEAVGRSQSAVSLQIQRLEGDVGASVFHRNRQGVELTTAGERLLGYAQRLIQINDEAIFSFNDTAPQAISLGVTPDFAESVLPEVFQRFMQEHPGVEVTLRVDTSKALVEALHREELDVVIALTRDDPLNQGVFTEASMIWIARRGFPGPGDRPLPLALFEAPCTFRSAALDALAAANRPYRIAAISPSLGGLVAAVRVGFCVTVRTRHMLAPMLADVGEELDLPKLPPVTFCLYTRQRERHPARDDLIELCRQHF